MPVKTVLINRAPVLALWGAVVAERLGYDREESLTLGKALAGMNAQSKGRRLGIYTAKPEGEKKPRPAGREMRVEICGREIAVRKTASGIRAVSGESLVDPSSIEAYLERSFGENLAAVRDAMTRLARAIDAEDLPGCAFSLYEKFRPAIASGTRGWGQKGTLDLEKILALARKG